MIGEAIDTVLALGWALTAWIAVLALTVTAALYAVAAAVAWPPYAVCRALTAALAASRALRAWQAQPDQYRPPQRPSWATTTSYPAVNSLTA